MNKKMILLLIVSFLLVSFAVSADEGIDLEFIESRGYVNYIIKDSGTDITGHYSIQSELEFPLDYKIAKVNYNKNIDIYYFDELYLSFSKNITDTDSKFKDYDWINKDPFTEPNIYGETETEVNHSDFDIRMETGKNNNYGVGLGFNYWKNDYSMSNGYQIDRINDYRSEFGKDQKVLEYEIEVMKPYIYVEYNKNINDKYSILLNGEFSPRLYVKDYDNHILRNKISKGETAGYGFGGGFEVERRINDRLGLSLAYNHSILKSYGTQTQTFSDNSEIKIDQEHNLENQSFKIAFNYIF